MSIFENLLSNLLVSCPTLDISKNHTGVTADAHLGLKVPEPTSFYAQLGVDGGMELLFHPSSYGL